MNNMSSFAVELEIGQKKVEELPFFGSFQNQLGKDSPIKVTACDEVTIGKGFDILVFPRSVRYKNITEKEIPVLVNHLKLKQQETFIQFHSELISQKYIFICCHQNRDARCGKNGPVLFDNFQSYLKMKNIEPSKLRVRKCSHVGRHEYSSNLILFPLGDWFGYVTSSYIPELVDYVLNGSHDIVGSIHSLWRGRLGLDHQQTIILNSKQ